MSEAEFLGMFVLALATFIGVFIAINKPLNANTKAMTTLTLRMEQLSDSLKQQEIEQKIYKEHMKESQKRQWVVIDEHGKQILKHDILLQNLNQTKQTECPRKEKENEEV